MSWQPMSTSSTGGTGAKVHCTLHHTATGHTSDITSLAFTSSILASSSSDKSIRLWDVQNKFSELSSSPLCGHTYGVHSCVFSPGGDMLASSSTDGTCVLWDVASGQKMGTLKHPSQGSIRTCCFAPNGRLLATGSDDEKLCVWDLATRTIIRTLEGPEASIVAAVFTPHSELLVAGSSIGDLRVWDAVYGHGRSLALELEAHDLGVTCVAVSPTYGSAGPKSEAAIQVHYLLASGGFDNMLKLWDILTVKGSPDVMLVLRSTLSGHTGPVQACCFSPTDRMLASGGADKTVRLWDPVKAEAVCVIEGHSRYVTCCAFSVDGTLLATGSNDRNLHVWSVSPSDLLLDPNPGADKIVPAKPAAIPAKGVGTNVSGWSQQDVCDWLGALGLSQYGPAFIQNAIDGQELITLTDDTLKTALNVSALGHRNKILRAVKEIGQHPAVQTQISDEGAPDEYLCPITRELMRDPVMASDGYTYERAAITAWMNSGKINSPMTNAVLTSDDLTPNRSLKMLVTRYTQQHQH